MDSLENSRLWRAGLAGSMAGLVEHTLLYPIDTVKTRMQAVLISQPQHTTSFLNTFASIIRHERARTLFRGWTAVVMAAVPSHAMYFGAYEYSKHRLCAEEGLHPLKIALSGAFAAMAHDAIVTPFDVIKQRMQLQNCQYASIISCARCVSRREGYTSFFRSYPTTVLLNIPTFSTNFVVYESAKVALKGSRLGDEECWQHHLVAGGLAGGVAGLVSNPVDVIKTAIQTDQEKGYKSIRGTVAKLMSGREGYRVFMSGASARAAYMVPSAAITWTVYEAMKTYLKFPIHDIPMV